MSKKKTIASLADLDGITVIRFEQSHLLETRDLVELKECLQQTFETGAGGNLLLDCTEVQAISTGALAVLLKFQRALFEHGRRLKLFGLTRRKITPVAHDSYSHELFRVFELDRFFDVCDESDTLEQCAAAMHTLGTLRSSDSSAHQPVSC